jgi:predicted ABC-type ATPase
LANIPEVLKIANQGFVFDNSLNEPRKMLETDAGVIVWGATDQPSWVISLIENLS